MTAFATAQGYADGASWTWEVRSVNGRGFGLKVRLPDGLDGLEAHVRAATAKVATRGNVTIGLRLQRDQGEGAVQLDVARVDAVLAALDQIQERAFDAGVTLGQPTAADVLAARGVLVAAPPTALAEVMPAMQAGFSRALEAMIAMRDAEGAALHDVLRDQIAQIETLTQQAVVVAQARSAAAALSLNKALARVIAGAVGADPDRIAQELALLAVKADITEEIDRLGAHIQAARDLLAAEGPVGRKLDFLTQEFNREANTLCAKAQDVALTQIGLALKAVIDQMREQVQNVE